MTRAEFESIDGWSELESVASDYGYEDEFDDVYSKEAYEDRVLDEIRDMISDGISLKDLQSNVEEYPDPNYYDRFILDGYGSWTGTDDDDSTFRDYRDNILERMESNGELDRDYEDDSIDEDTSEDEEDEEDEAIYAESNEQGFDLNEVFAVLDEIDCDTAQAQNEPSDTQNDLQTVIEEEAVCVEVEAEDNQEKQEMYANLEELFA